MQLSKIPATVVTGFLGSGKTTLLRNLINNTQGLRVAVIVNEFGALDIDASTLRECAIGCDEEQDSGNGIYELANGCICCTVQDEFHPLLQELIKRRDSIDHILIETSGLALPKPLVQAFQWPDIRSACTVDAVITVIDSPAVAAGTFAESPEAVDAQRQADESLDHAPELRELFEDQLSAADLVILNKTDLLGADDLAKVQRIVEEKLPRAVKIINTSHCDLKPELILHVGAAAEDQISEIHTHHDHHHDHESEHHHAHEAFDSLVLSGGELDPDTLILTLKSIVEQYPVYRIKGHIAVANKPMRLQVQGVGNRFDSHFDRAWAADEKRQSQIVLIGMGLPEEKIHSQIFAH
jgi:cobalamin biosynthesis protein CobW